MASHYITENFPKLISNFVSILINFHRRITVLTEFTKYFHILEKIHLTTKVPTKTSENSYIIQGAVNKELFKENIYICGHTLNIILKDALKWKNVHKICR